MGLTLLFIPKANISEYFLEFYPINLCNVTYKVVMKIITNRLREVMNKLVSSRQCIFAPSRCTVDNILVA